MGCLTTLLPDTRSHDNEPLNPVPEDRSALLLSTSELNNSLKIYNTPLRYTMVMGPINPVPYSTRKGSPEDLPE